MSSPKIRQDRRRALYASTAWLVGPLLPMNSALARVLVDATDPVIATLSSQLVRGLGTARERAVAIHDHVRDRIAFGYTAHAYALSAADVQKAGVGYSLTKSTLFVALLRAAGIEARQQYVDLNGGLLHGLIDFHTRYVDHCYTEVLLGGAWIPTDSYVVDRALWEPARNALRASGRRYGFGVHADGSIEWDGRSPAFGQFVERDASLSRVRWGSFRDAAAFYEATPTAWNRQNPTTRVTFPLAAVTANEPANALRARGAGVARTEHNRRGRRA
jgi:Transglutaminase-like superfamily